MARKRAARIVVLFIIGALVAVGTGVAYRAFMAPWRGDVREPLIAAAFVGVAERDQDNPQRTDQDNR
jgi:hypothetical protein